MVKSVGYPVALLVAFAWVSLTSQVSAMANPSGIQWTASPANFVSSLYLSVLGRPKEPGPTGWESKITSNPYSRYGVFMDFVRSDEYRSKYGSMGGDYYVYWKSAGPHRKVYAVSKLQPGNYNGQASGPFSFGVATASRDFYQTYFGNK